ncbi:MAG: HesA/MoeB/ThiF family protein [Rhodobacteraceae bacterium]|nr:HesA/MoeB/ThiF family protein [Paracoccaceae bacterium]
MRLSAPARTLTAASVGIGAILSTGGAAAQNSGPEPVQPLLWLPILGIALLLPAYIMLLRWLRRRAAARIDTGQQEQPVFSPVELERYSRHILLREIGGEGQRQFRNARVAVIGAGGLGSPALLYLAAAGVGRITVIDDDRVELSNLQRQIIHADEGVGRLKVESAADAMRALNPHIEINPVSERLQRDSQELLAGHDLVLDGSDSFDTRFLVNEICVEQGIRLVSGAIGQWEGQVTVLDAAEGPCLACLFPEKPSPELAPSCAEAGVLAPLPGIIGAIMAAEALKVISDTGAALRGKLLIYDALWGQIRTVSFSGRPDCRICGKPD